MSERQALQQQADQRWLVEYDHAGATWSLDGFYALDAEDAEEKLRAIGRTGRVCGEIVVSGGATFWAPRIRVVILLLSLGALAGVLLAQLAG